LSLFIYQTRFFYKIRKVEISDGKVSCRPVKHKKKDFFYEQNKLQQLTAFENLFKLKSFFFRSYSFASRLSGGKFMLENLTVTRRVK
jgi:hypothetical protein